MKARTSVAVLERIAEVPQRRAVALTVGPAAELPERSAEAPAEARSRGVAALRARLAGSSAREHVVLDFLEDDLREARAALSAVAAYVANVEAALADAESCQGRLLSLALGGAPGERVDYLATTLASVRRRIGQVAARM